MIYDCFLFFNELELLELRLKTLGEVVDCFVIVESDRSFTGNKKEFLLEKNLDRFGKYKIIYIQVTDSPERETDWNIEEFQRNCIQRGLANAQDGDKIILSDLDEIPDPQKILGYKDTLNPVTFELDLYYYYVNCKSERKWCGAILYPYGYDGLSPQDFRILARKGINKVENGGWHYTFIGGIDNVMLKLKNLSDAHVVKDKIGTDEDILDKYSNNKLLWDDAERLSIVDNNAPHIKEFIRKYPHVFYRDTD